MSRPRILVVEDEQPHQLVISKALDSQYELIIAPKYQEALSLIETQMFDLILLDIMLDEADGFELCARIKANQRLRFVPIIFLSSKAEVSSKVLGFNLGADDYVTKPCDPMELRARINAKLKRQMEYQEREQVVRVGDLIFYLDRQVLEIRGENETKPCDLTPLEFKLLYFMARHKEHVLSRDQILDNVWGQSTNVLDRTVDTFVASLRRKLGPYAKCIKSVHGVGYKFLPQSNQAAS